MVQAHTPCEALKTSRCLLIQYDGYTRVVEVHAVGYSRENNAIMRVWQVRGGSSTNTTGWKLLRLDETLALQLLDEKSCAPRNEYKRNDEAMVRITCQI